VDGPAKTLEQRREHVEADGHAAREPQRAAQFARAVSDRPDRVPYVLKHPLTELDQAFSRRRHAHLAADAQEQRLAELLFEQQDLAADRRLRHVQLRPQAVNDPVSAIACRISSCRRSTPIHRVASFASDGAVRRTIHSAVVDVARNRQCERMSVLSARPATSL